MGQGTIRDLFTQYPYREISFQGHCHDCGKELEIVFRLEDNGTMTKSGGLVYESDDWEERKYLLRCGTCCKFLIMIAMAEGKV